MSTPTGILRKKGDDARFDVFFYPIPRPLSYSKTRLGTHVAISSIAYAPYTVPTIVTLTAEEQAKLQPVGLYVTDHEDVILSPEKMLKHLQAVALALAGQFVEP